MIPRRAVLALLASVLLATVACEAAPVDARDPSADAWEVDGDDAFEDEDDLLADAGADPIAAAQPADAAAAAAAAEREARASDEERGPAGLELSGNVFEQARMFNGAAEDADAGAGASAELLQTGDSASARAESGNPDDMDGDDVAGSAGKAAKADDEMVDPEDLAARSGHGRESTEPEVPKEATEPRTRDLGETELLSLGAHRDFSKAAWGKVWELRQAQADKAKNDAAAGVKDAAAPAAAPAATPAKGKNGTEISSEIPERPPIVHRKDPSFPSRPLTGPQAAEMASKLRPEHPPRVSDLMPLLRYYSPSLKDTVSTVDPRELHGDQRYVFKGVVAFLYAHATVPGGEVAPVYRFVNEKNAADPDHYFSVADTPRASTDRREGVAGFVYREEQTGLVPLVEYYCAEANDHMYSTSVARHMVKNGMQYVYKGVLGYTHKLRNPSDGDNYGGRVGGTLDKVPTLAPAATGPVGGSGSVDKNGVWQAPATAAGAALPKSGPVDGSGAMPAGLAMKDTRPPCGLGQSPDKDNCRSVGVDASSVHHTFGGEAAQLKPAASTTTTATAAAAADAAAASSDPSKAKEPIPAGAAEPKGEAAAEAVAEGKKPETKSALHAAFGAASDAHKSNVQSGATNTYGSATGETDRAKDGGFTPAGAGATGPDAAKQAALGTFSGFNGPDSARLAATLGATSKGPVIPEPPVSRKAYNPSAKPPAHVSGSADVADDTPGAKVSPGESPSKASSNGPQLPHPKDKDLVPMYRYWNPKMQDHYYTLDFSNLGNGKQGWQFQGVQAYVLKRRKSGSVPLYRYWNVRLGDHYYTTDYKELKEGKDGYKYKGVLAYVKKKQGKDTVPMYEYFNADAGDHFYTDNFDFLKQGAAGWKYVRVGFYVFPHPGGNLAPTDARAAIEKHGQVELPLQVPLYRYWNVHMRDHFYTTLWKEVEVGTHGWEYQGVQALVYATRAPGTVALHRYWNLHTLDHFYTTNSTTLGNGGKNGWVYEGVQCYVSAFRSLNTVPLYGYFNDVYRDHFYTTKHLGNQIHGWKLDGIQAFVWDTPLKNCSKPPPAPTVRYDGLNTGKQDYLTGLSGADAAAAAAGSTASATAGSLVPSASTFGPGSTGAVAVDQKDLAKVNGKVADPLAGAPASGVSAQNYYPATAPPTSTNTASPASMLLEEGQGEEAEAPVVRTPADNAILNGKLAPEGSPVVDPSKVPAAAPSPLLTTPAQVPIITDIRTNPRTMPDLAVKNPWHPKDTFLRPAQASGASKPKVVIPNKDELVPLYRYWNGVRKDHFYTTKTFSLANWQFQGLVGYGFKHHKPGTIPLFRYFNRKTYDHFYSVKYRKDGDGDYKYQGIVMFITTKAKTGQVPLYQYFNALFSDHFYATSWKELGQGKAGWQFEGVQGYLYPPLRVARAENPASPDHWTGGKTPVPLYAYASDGDHFYSTSGAWAPSFDKNGREIVAKKGSKSSKRLLGVAGLIYLREAPNTVPLHRYFNKAVNDHFYTTNWMTLGKAGKGGWRYEGIQGYVFSKHLDGTVPLYRYYDAANNDHIYTTKFDGMRNKAGAKLQGIACYVREFSGDMTNQPSWLSGTRRQPLYRYYNKQTMDHFYTTRINLLGKPVGKDTPWQYQGVSAYLPVDAVRNETTALHVYMNTYSSDHFYTANYELLKQGGKYGWKYQGVEGQIFKTHVAGTVPFYQYYNAGKAKDHFYTTNWSVLGHGGADGWIYQGVVGFVFPTRSV